MSVKRDNEKLKSKFNRRNFLRATALAGGAAVAGLGASGSKGCESTQARQSTDRQGPNSICRLQCSK